MISLVHKYYLRLFVAERVPVDINWHWLGCGTIEIFVCIGAKFLGTVFIQPVALTRDAKWLVRNCPFIFGEEIKLIRCDEVLSILADVRYLLARQRRARYNQGDKHRERLV